MAFKTIVAVVVVVVMCCNTANGAKKPVRRVHIYIVFYCIFIQKYITRPSEKLFVFKLQVQAFYTCMFILKSRFILKIRSYRLFYFITFIILYLKIKTKSCAGHGHGAHSSRGAHRLGPRQPSPKSRPIYTYW